MNGGKDCEAGDERHAAPVQVPIGWQRKAERGGGVIYISPSGSLLSSLEQVKSYLLTDGTCKCGLECPLILHKVFNFDPRAAVKQRTAEDVKADEDVTKLCIHKRKLLAVATLRKSMGTHPPLRLTSPGGGTPSVLVAHSTSQRAIRTKLHDGLPNAVGPDCKNPFKMMMAAGQQQQQQRLYIPQEMGGAQQPELYSVYARPQRLGSGEPGPKSPYRVGYGSMLSPPPSSVKLYGDGSQSPCADSLGSPDGFQRTNPCGFPGAGSPGSASIHGNTRMPLSPPSVMLHGSPAGQLSCIMTGRTSTPLSPTATAKSPVMNMNMPRGNFHPGMDMPRAAFHHKTQPPAHPVQPPPSIPPSCALQKRQLTFEKDPLGILDPIPSKQVSKPPINAPHPSNFQPNIHSQVQMMNVNIPPPAIVPLASNLPLPTVKSGPVGHGGHVQRTQQGGPASSMSPSPVTSPVHMAGPALGRMEASPHRSRSSSTSSEHGSFAMPSGHQGPCGNIKAPPRSPRSAMGSPRPAMPSSPSTNKTDAHHQYKDSQMLPGMGNSICPQQHSNPMYSPTSSSSSSSSMATPSASQKGHPGLLGMPLNQILNQQNAASFPASSLLSAAAKAQLANQNKLSSAGSSPAAGGGGAGMGAGGNGNGGGGGHPGSTSGPRGMEEHSTLNSMLPPNSTMLLKSPEGQSGRAALRDKLMAQQRDPMRKRKQSSGNTAVNHDTSNNMVYNMLNKRAMVAPHMAGPSATDQLRKVGRLGNLPQNTSMAQLLQSMSCQSSHNHRPGLSPGPQGSAQLHYSDSTGLVPAGPQQNLLAQQRLRGPGDAMQHCQNMDPSGGHLVPRPSQFPDMMVQMHDGMPLGRPHNNAPPLSHPGPHPSQQNLLHSMRRTNMVMPHEGGDGGCTQNISDTGNPSSLGCGMSSLQQHVNPGGGQMYQQQVHQGMQQGAPPHPAYQGQQHFSDNPPYADANNASSMACLYQNCQGMLSHPQFREGQQPQGEGLPSGPAGGDRGPGGGPESVDAIYRAVVDAASKGMHVTITTTVSGTTQASPVPALSAMSAFTASIGEPVNLPQAVSSVLHRHQDVEEVPQQARPRQVRHGRGQKDPGKSTPEGPEPSDYFRSPGRGTPRGQWDGEHGGGFDVHSNNAWGGEEFLECSTQVRSSPCIERPVSLAPAPPCPNEGSNDHGFLDDGYRFNNCNRTLANYKERLEQTVERCVLINGATPHFSSRGYGDVLGPPRQELTGDDQSPSSSTSLEGPLATAKDYSHYNGHFNGMAPSPSDTKSLSSEEDLRQPDSPSSELLHYRSRTFNMGELVWGQLKGFPPWPAKLAGDEQVHSAAMQLREQAKVEPEKLKTLTHHDLEALDRATKRGLKPGKLNNHLEAAIHEAMSELDKMSGTIPSRDRQVKLPKPKRRKISR
ncbi:methyl-CpG-binding domain protein 5 isoform X2 [Pseudochaenichthys georgianus]|uniref:methyl-CpG-binding domain protein 5 isoform X2 n=1 Tax=Pseudochaenichthys georgianus TaxID=52239 RepID=UPI00146CBBF5|nr:methyl-CpG-binding domain protein 5-like isoform X2 [Pseudochaenichthys georgianus]